MSVAYNVPGKVVQNNDRSSSIIQTNIVFPGLVSLDLVLENKSPRTIPVLLGSNEGGLVSGRRFDLLCTNASIIGQVSRTA